MKKLKFIIKSEPFVFQIGKYVEFNGSNMIQLAISYQISGNLYNCVGKQLNDEDSTSNYAFRLLVYNAKH